MPSNYVTQSSTQRAPVAFNVIDYGATGNGTTSDSAAIQAAINAAQGTNGGKVFFPAGNYFLTVPLTISNSGITLEGVGWGGGPGAGGGGNKSGTILSLNAAVNDYAIKFTPPNSVRLDGVVIRNLRIDCNGANQTSGGGGIYAYGAAYCTFEKLWIEAPYDDGIVLRNDNLGGYGHHHIVKDCFFSNGQLAGSGGHGRGLALGADSSNGSDESFVYGCLFQGCGTNGNDTYCQCIDNSGLQLIQNCVFVAGSSATTGFRAKSGEGSHLIGCIFDGGNGQQVDWGTPNGRIIGCQFYQVSNNSQAIIASAQNNVISDCTFVSNQTNNASRCAVDGGFASGINYVFNCTVQTQGSWTNGIFSGTQNLYIRNVTGYNPVGVLGPPAVPASGTALVNPYPVDCTVYVAGGTVSAVAVGGSSTGLTSGMFRIPCGQSIKVTYTVAPTWTWFGD